MDQVLSQWNHIEPIGDLIEHNTGGGECECRPARDYNNRLVIHSALDNREFDEIAEAINEQ